MIEFVANLLHYFFSFLLILSVIVFVHEFGHYFVAKLCGVRVKVFSIGFGREIFGINDRSGTRWKFSLLPFGGYVKMFGDSSEASTADNEVLEKMTGKEKAVSFHHKPLWKKAAIVAAGPAANFILSILILTYFVYSTGIASTAPVVGSVIENTPAAQAKLQPGDRILFVDDKAIETFNEISENIITNLGAPVTLRIVRNNEEQELTITPIEYEEVDALGNISKRPLIGFRSQQVSYEDVSLGAALLVGVERTYFLCVTSLQALGQMIAGERSTEELKGPIGIAKLSGQVTAAGETASQTFHIILWFIAMLSANLGLVNLLPIPMLDGGHLLFYTIHALKGKPMAQQIQEYSFRFGFLLIITLMAFTLYNDIRQI